MAAVISYCESGHYLDSLDLNPTTFMKCIILINYILSNTFKIYVFLLISFKGSIILSMFMDLRWIVLSFNFLTNRLHRSRDSILKYHCLQCCQLQNLKSATERKYPRKSAKKYSNFFVLLM